MVITVLDNYDYVILPGVIRIELSATNDPDLVDIMSEIERSNGSIFVEGSRYSYLDDYLIFSDEKGVFIDLYVVETV